MSMMNAIAGFTCAMYEKFWSGPTPTYAPPLTPASRSAGTTCRYDFSFEIRLSLSK